MKFTVKVAAILCLALLGLAGLAFARGDTEGPSPALIAGETGRVIRVIDGDSLVLEGGLRVELSAVQAPKPAWREKGFAAWPGAARSKQALETMALGKDVQLYYGGPKTDRYGRTVAQIWTLGDNPIWLQENMVLTGFARVYPQAGQAQDTPRLYAAETAARAKALGIWKDPFYAVRAPDPNPLAQHVDSVQIVEGIIISAADVRGTVYLNFGSDYKTDFTIAVSKKNNKKFTKAGLDLLALEGARVRVRGWIELGNGPVIWLSNAERLEVLD